MNFNEIPDVPKNLIFKRFTNTELVQLGHVCHQWEALQEIQYRARDTLVLLVGGPALDAWTESRFNEFQYHNLVAEPDAVVPMDTVPQSPQYLAKWFGLSVRAFSNGFAQYLVRKFTNITTLIIAGRVQEPDWTQELLYLFTRWSANLRTVKLFIHGNANNQQTIHVNPLLNAMNDLPALTHLTFDFYRILFHEPNDTQFFILARLTEFNLSCQMMTQQMIDSFAQNAIPNDGLTRIGLHVSWIHLMDGNFRPMFEPNVISAKYSHLLYTESDIQHILLNCNFINLTHFCLDLELTQGTSYLRIMTQFSAFTSLTNLMLSLDPKDQNIWKTEYDMVAAGQLVLPHIPSVRVLVFILESHEHSTLTYTNLGRIFPNVRYFELRFLNIECRRCFPRYNSLRYLNVEDIRLHDCLRATLSGLKSFRVLIRCKIRLGILGWNEVMPRVRDIIHNDDEYRFELTN